MKYVTLNGDIYVRVEPRFIRVRQWITGAKTIYTFLKKGRT